LGEIAQCAVQGLLAGWRAEALMIQGATRVAPEKAVFRPALSRSLIAGVSPENDMSEFWKKYQHPRWQEKRLAIMKRADFRCEHCYRNDRQLHVHHKIYRNGADPWEYSDSELMCLCHECHEMAGDGMKGIKEGLAKLDLIRMQIVRGYIDGLVAHQEYGDTCGPERETAEFADWYLQWPIDGREHAYGFLTAVFADEGISNADLLSKAGFVDSTFFDNWRKGFEEAFKAMTT
jgi:hypothetical protein